MDESSSTCVKIFVFSQLKEMCRRELEKSESEIKKNGSIIGEYKQVNAHTQHSILKERC